MHIGFKEATLLGSASNIAEKAIAAACLILVATGVEQILQCIGRRQVYYGKKRLVF